LQVTVRHFSFAQKKSGKKEKGRKARAVQIPSLVAKIIKITFWLSL